MHSSARRRQPPPPPGPPPLSPGKGVARGWCSKRAALVALVGPLVLLQFALLPHAALRTEQRQLASSRSAPPVLDDADAAPPIVEPSRRLAELAAIVTRTQLRNLSVFGNVDLLVTFGTSTLAPFVSNWVSTLVRADATALLVGALDEGLYAACVAAGVPAIRIDEEVDRFDPGTLGQGYFRKDFEA